MSHIYPIPIPPIEVMPNLDFLLLELPPRYMPFMPNGLGYVNNILKQLPINFQTIDISIIFYHRFHSKRILEDTNTIITSSGYALPEDPWDNTNTSEWFNPEIIDYFWPQLNEVIEDIVIKKPKMVGISLNGNNRFLAKKFVEALKQHMPEVIIVVGGYDCIYHNVAIKLFDAFDYMVIGDAELVLGPLVNAIVRGEDEPIDMIGIISKYDSSDRKWQDPPLFKELDSIDFPRYEWVDTILYQSFTGHHMIPIMIGRGCNWRKCRFCAEGFVYRNHSPKRIIEEIQFFVQRGFHTFHFNDSDCNSNPKLLSDICLMIIEKRLTLRLIGQLRIDKRNTNEYFKLLAKAGFKHLRFGVDGWSDRTLQLQNKGYNMRLVLQNLRDCHEAGIYTSVNVVMGVPGETENDIDDIIKNIVNCKDCIDIIEGINTLILAAGSEYYKESEKYNICFNGDKVQIYKDHPHVIPVDLWYSKDPCINQDVRLKRLDRLCKELHKNGLHIGSFAARRIKHLTDKVLSVE